MITVKDIHTIVTDICAKYRRNKRYHEPEEIEGVYAVVNQMPWYRDTSCDPQVRPATEEEKAEYAYVQEGVWNEFDAGVNKLFGFDVKVGEPYSIKVEPWGILEWEDVKLAVYSDDAGQCDYIRLDGESLGAGAYNLCPEDAFIYFYYDYLIDNLRAELANTRTEE